MRVSDEMILRMLASHLSATQKTLFTIQKRIASGRTVEYPHEDPSAFEIIRILRGDRAAVAQYQRNLDAAEKELLTTDNILQNVVNLFHRAHELAVRSGDGTLAVADRVAMGREVNHLLESLVALGNFSEGTLYRFGGLRSDTPPYRATDTNGDGLVDTVTYQGSLEVKPIEIGPGFYLPVTFPGSHRDGENALFQTRATDLFLTLIALRDVLLAGRSAMAGETFTVDPGTDVLTVAGVYRTGTAVMVSSTGNLPTGLMPNTVYYAIEMPSGIRLAATLEDARNGVALDLVDSGSGEHTVTPQIVAQMSEALDHLTALLSAVGAREEACTFQREALLNQETLLTQALERVESLDLAKAAVELTSQQTAYEAAARASALLLHSPTLLDFL